MSPPGAAATDTDGGRSVSLDLVRGLAALAVAAGHLRNFMFDGADRDSSLAWKLFAVASSQAGNAVIVFFVLSGYLIGRHVAARFRSGRWSWSGYAIDRLTRLWVVLVPALVLTVALDWIGTHVLAGDLYLGRADPGLYGSVPDVRHFAENHSLPTFFGNLFFVQNGILVNVYGVNGPLWSLANEFWYYVLFPLGYAALRPGGRPAGRLLCAGLGIALCRVLPADVLLYGLTWLLGVCVAALEPYRDRLVGRRMRTRLSVSAGAAFLLSLYLVPRFGDSDKAVTDAVTAVLFAILIWLVHDAAIGEAGIVGRTVAAASTRLSNISYTLYLTHFPFMALALCVICDNRRFAPGSREMLLYVGILGLSVLYATALYKLFEKRTLAVKGVIRGIVRRVGAGPAPRGRAP